jgi:glycosyltransferase involved in cell wall biosynthesis
MKLIIQIPCYNEAATLPATVRDLPRSIAGIDQIELLVIDDGSTDGTADVARSLGVEHVLSLGSNHGLAKAFARGLEHALALGADIVVNTDGDNQYRGEDVAKLLQPILENRADMVIGCRPIVDHPEFGAIKKGLQLAGSWALRQVSKTTVRDAASGFRAFTRETCQRLYIYSTLSYCMETLIQAGTIGLRVASVDVRVNPTLRPSRIVKSIPDYVLKSGMTIFAMLILYRPGRFFSSLAAAFFAVALGIGVRFLYHVYLAPAAGRTYLPSLILLAICALSGFLLVMVAIVAELIRAQRQLTEENLYLLRRNAARR